MNTDIRIAVDFWDHPKTVKLERRGGLNAVKSLQILWLWAAQNKPCGHFIGLDSEDIEIAARWTGENGFFVKLVVDLGWLEENEDGFRLHGWAEHNPWAAGADNRGDKARFSRLAKINKELYGRLINEGRTSITKKEYDLLTDVKRSLTNRISPAPAPAPSPSPKEEKKKDLSSTPDDSVMEVFRHWQKVMGTEKAKASPERISKIRARLKDYTVDQLKEAIDGCRKSEHHMGKNDRKTKYNDIELICRDCKHVDSFLQETQGEEENSFITGKGWAN
jgi:hypothetical protein